MATHAMSITLTPLSTPVLLTGAVLALVLWMVSVIAYRLLLHPLASVPGPPLAAATRLYAFYHNIIKNGTFYLEIERLHKVYGPIVRIAPNEIHLVDPSHYDTIYAIGGKFYKDAVFYSGIGDEYSGFATVSNEDHRRRRAPLESFFSRRAVLELEALVRAKVDKLCRLVEAGLAQGEVMDLHAAFRGLSIDVITEYAFDDCWNQLDRDDLGQWFSDMGQNVGVSFWVAQQFPFLLKGMKALPLWAVRRLGPAMSDLLDCQERGRRIVQEIHGKVEKGVKPRRRTIFHNLLDPEVKIAGHQRPSVENMAEEAFAILIAASDTTGNAMTVAAYHVITNPRVYAKLMAELTEAFPVGDGLNNMSFAQLERLPYLTGVVKEGLRLSYGVIGRLPRVVPRGGATFNDFYFPEGTVVGMSSYLLHRNPDVFPNPTAFEPERWINPDPETSKALRTCLVPFSRGSRGCIGQNLAMCELYLTLGTLFRRVQNMAAEEVGELRYVDYFTAYHGEERQRLKVFASEGNKPKSS
ncbi:cytochrome P450 [Podospora aff. communis PSN243]|uniref:Cytochrome P450 n=1 Tax=Podospora aff. communis PSN243 TaxID=3040156 RepID=A0AAV9GK21_9PEZI|nr:cytochrome P450 [Podospora aff. communis PSN243]